MDTGTYAMITVLLVGILYKVHESSTATIWLVASLLIGMFANWAAARRKAQKKTEPNQERRTDWR